MNEMELLSQHRPSTSGPSLDLTERAQRDFDTFVIDHRGTETRSTSTPAHRLTRRRVLVFAAIAVTLLAAGGVVRSISGDGVSYVGPVTQIGGTAELSIVIQDSNIGPCIELRVGDQMSGGCGVDFSMPLGIGVGSIADVYFAQGWAPPSTVRVEMTFTDGVTVEVPTVTKLQGYDITFFATILDRPSGEEIALPLLSVAFDADGNIIATYRPTDEVPNSEHHDG